MSQSFIDEIESVMDQLSLEGYDSRLHVVRHLLDGKTTEETLEAMQDAARLATADLGDA